MREKKWMIYGANGYTGKLIIEEAITRGHTPILAGRSREKIEALANRYQLDSMVFSIDDRDALHQAVKSVDLVLLAAGPFVKTSLPVVRACLQHKTHYVDITGEIPVFEKNILLHNQAVKKGITIISGVGFDVVPTDSLAKYVSDKLPGAQRLEIGITGLGSFSRGTLITMLAHLHRGVLKRVAGKYQMVRHGLKSKKIPFPQGKKLALPLTWGDLATAYHSTEIPNITIYMAVQGPLARVKAVGVSLLRFLLQFALIRNLLISYVKKRVTGPNESVRMRVRAQIWAEVTNAVGVKKRAWLECVEGYQFTAYAGVRIVEKILSEKKPGSYTPSQAFGTDFVLEIPGTKRFDVI